MCKQVSWTRNQRPDFHLMNDEQYVIKIPAVRDINLTFQTQKEHQNEIHYIGIFPDVVSEIIRNMSYTTVND